VENQVLVVNDWTTAYYTEFTRAGGMRPIVVSYGSSPVFELLDAQKQAESMQGADSQAPLEPPTAAVVSDGSCFRQIEFAGILKGTQHRDLARKWLDFMLTTTFQEDMPLLMYVFPVNPEAKLNETFAEHLAVPVNPAFVSPEEIAAKREQWLQAWMETVLR
jgi:thiamine transport system substrate-binding protein